MYKEISEKLLNKYATMEILFDEPLKEHTSFKIGGPADLLVRPTSIEQIRDIVKIIRDYDVPYFILGNGSNLLVNDKGFRGVIIQLYKNMNEAKIEGNKVIAQAGILLSTLAKRIAASSLKGFEFASGIPGTLGGAIYMNAGAYGGEMKNHVSTVTAIDHDGELHILSLDECELGYRESIFQQNNYFILEVEMTFEKGDPEEIKAITKELTSKRKDKQPLDQPSAGSTFKRPEGYYAGKLIMDAHLRGFSIGDAQVSEKHCGFIINKGSATAQDVTNLINHIRKTVYHHFGVAMQPEVRILGETCLENVQLEELE
ncbi:UDP-N-acetylmuramate dehydrogenase [Vallitalea okinawensis]|uniref:UDP-N-acetylmuramate dehydrogenase n=1 Tax=Vallitalea okinawensis TaxID=2078660 RepID=UPI000CFCCE74|nr:UDP-N-acetylmuramate dehydrogenase [Vallitalea okinawensis]